MNRMGLILLVVLLAATMSGCGPAGVDRDLGQVTGTITLDGKPLSGASVQFLPKGEGATATGRTDAAGKYELWYTGDVKGAALGSHTVRIETPPNPEPGAMEPPPQLPAKYNTESTLTADVKSGENTFNFELTSQ
ncbi:MAG: carboxypeptidase regulatory-like domain-containing protein [Pirellulales bacterium]|nr:carboxypeptidase regulatory-like domain-containing protein [Pirellulales bacterium]